MKREWQSMASGLLHTLLASCFSPCDICAQNNLCGRETGLKIWQYLFFSEPGVVSKLLLIPWQLFNP